MNIGIIVAAGSGERLFKTLKIKKQYYKLNGYKEVFLHPVETFINEGSFSTILLIVPKGDKELVRLILKREEIQDKLIVIEGGKTRSESVNISIDYLKKNLSEATISKATVFIHDGDRPLMSENLLERLIEASKTSEAVIPVLPVFDSMIKIANQEYVNRQEYLCIHTPQVFRLELLMKALSYAKGSKKSFGDEGSVIQYYGYKASYVPSEINNLKITDMATLRIVEKWEKIYG